MKFVEQTGVNWQQQIKAVEMEIEQQKREWEEKRLAQLQQEELERQKNEKEENELLTYSREDALNKVNIKSSSKFKTNRKSAANNNVNKSSSSKSMIKSEVTSPVRSKNSNGTPQSVTQNGIVKKSPAKSSIEDSGSKRSTRNTQNRVNQSVVKEESKSGARLANIIPRRALSRKSDKSTSSILSKRTSTSESTRSTSMSRQTSSIRDDSDSECSLDVMIDSNDVNDSDSNSNAKAESNFDSTSQDDCDTLIDSTLTDETTVERKSKTTSSPRTRSRGTVKINLWSLDDSPILPPKRQKFNKSIELNQLKADFGVKECKVSVTDIHMKSTTKPSPSRVQKRLLSSAKNNHTLDSWIQKVPEPLNRENDEKPQKQIQRATRQNSQTANKTL